MYSDLELNWTFPLEYSLIELDKGMAIGFLVSLCFRVLGFIITLFLFMISTVCFGVWQFDSKTKVEEKGLFLAVLAQ